MPRPSQRRRRTGGRPDVPGPPRDGSLTGEEYAAALCRSKIPFPTRRSAVEAAGVIHLARPQDPELHDYRCDVCRDWHLAPPQLAEAPAS